MSDSKLVGWIITAVLVGGLGIVALAWVIPQYNVWSQNMKGQANLRQQEWEKQIAVEEAKAEKESATLKAEAEVERAKGVAEANKIIGDSLDGNESYLRYLWIQTLSDPTNSTIYVPTEANLPILEAGQRP